VHQGHGDFFAEGAGGATRREYGTDRRSWSISHGPTIEPLCEQTFECERRGGVVLPAGSPGPRAFSRVSTSFNHRR
jgi:hypothetical protein